MARINFEDSLYSDVRFINLISKCGSLEFALGSLIRAWGLGQKYYLNEKTNRMIPLKKWNQQGIKMDIIEVGLAEIIDDHVYIKGAEKQFAWLLRQRAAGVASHKARYAHSVKNLTMVEPTLTNVERRSSSYSSSSSSSSSNSNSKVVVVDVVLTQNQTTTTAQKPLVKENTHDVSNSVQRFEDSYKPEVQEFREFVKGLHLGSKPSIKKNVVKIAEHFDFVIDNFKTWCNDKVNSPAMTRIKTDEGRRTYFEVALLRQIGAIDRKEKQ